jgi:electron transfer flavoprotein-quinone oxidoreductase
MTETPNYDGEFDAVVVGAGLAGSSAALTMAREDLDVLLLERGNSPGAKNMFGGVLYTPTIRELADLDDAPLQRYVAERRYSMLTPDDETSISMRPGEWHEEPHNDAYTVLRGDFDDWFAEQAVDAGATLVTETTVTDLLRDDDGTIRGVETDRPNGSLRAPVVVLAEGANSLVSERAGLKDRDSREDVAVAVKEVLKFDPETIEDRFRVHDDAGAAYHYFGEGAVGEAFGGGFLYTNKRTVSVGVTYRIEDAASNDQTPEETLNAFKQHPAVAPLVRGGTTVEYLAKTIPEGGADAVPDLVHDGAVVVGDAAGLVFNNGVHLEGTNMAVESGYHAGQAVADAVQTDDVSAANLSAYRDALEDSFVVQNLDHYSWFHEQAAADRELLFERLPQALADAETEYFRMDRTPKATHVDRAKSRIIGELGGYLGAAKFAWKYRTVFS